MISIGERYRRLLAGANARPFPVRNDNAGTAGGEGARYIHVAELSFEADEFADHRSDLLCVTMVSPSAAKPENDSELLAFFVFEDLAQHWMQTKGSGIRAANIPLGRISKGGEIDLLASIYRVPANRAARRVLEDLRKLIPAIDYDKDHTGSQRVAESVFDRIDVLAQLPGFARILTGVVQIGAQTPGPSYVWFSNAPASADAAKIHSGQHGTAALIEVGTRKTGRAGRLIDYLREERRLAAGATGPNAAAIAGAESYHERDQRLRKTRDFAVRFGQRAFQRELSPRPLTILLSPDIMNAFAASGEPLPEFRNLLQMFDEGLRYEGGFSMPAVEIRSHSVLRNGKNYAFAIWGTAIVEGTVSLSRILVNETVNRLALINVDAEKGINPANGNECAWVDAEVEDDVKAAGLTTWDAQGYLILHLSAVARKNFAAFLTLDVVADTVRGASTDLFNRVVAAPGGLPRLTTVLRSLLLEEVPIRLIRPSCEQYLELAGSLPADEIMEELRYGEVLRPHLRTNKPGAPMWKMGPEFLNALNDGLEKRGSGRVLAMAPEVVQSLLAAVRNNVSGLPSSVKNPIIVVDDWRLRPHLRRLVELEFPHLAVVARRELLAPETGTLLGAIEIES